MHGEIGLRGSINEDKKMSQQVSVATNSDRNVCNDKEV